ncbi:MAG: F0F1 ATP synthase subunit A [Deltaproteobacteria bacterium]|nr:F0F1 ATP synthase subunit A [Deltaproteobacteria bacterium]MBW2019144.1 F0F1 ATP synthase subunit A [Deltaproteobacteria bacterium]MBW2073211.1 F0F1 ATP synthase subunit A [Deltaproteobacteria bacterium]RLB83831.1 MAG: ATP synthase F0 subunit A [Deltaproteobacteria bacterium]
MEHPILFLVSLAQLISPELGHLAHEYVHVVYSWFVMLLLIVLAYLATRGISMIPTKGQNVFELVIGGMEEFIVDITGEEGRRFFPILATVFIYIFVCNLLGLVPGFFPPTAKINTTLSCALVVVPMTHVIGVMYHGPKYIKHFLGPIWWMVPIIFPIELIGHTARVLSLTIRLFGNMAGHELVLAILFMLAGAFFAPLPIMALGIFVSLVQAFVFFLLSVMYFAGAMEHAH